MGNVKRLDLRCSVRGRHAGPEDPDLARIIRGLLVQKPEGHTHIQPPLLTRSCAPFQAHWARLHWLHGQGEGFSQPGKATSAERAMRATSPRPLTGPLETRHSCLKSTWKRTWYRNAPSTLPIIFIIRLIRE